VAIFVIPAVGRGCIRALGMTDDGDDGRGLADLAGFRHINIDVATTEIVTYF